MYDSESMNIYMTVELYKYKLFDWEVIYLYKSPDTNKKINNVGCLKLISQTICYLCNFFDCCLHCLLPSL